jgi:DNA-binding GntR family transcriptional regulator
MTASTLRHKAYERFKERLFAEELKPGQFVSQRELSELIKIPVGPLREALKRLEAEALVRLIPQRGIQIADLNVSMLNESFGLRRILELAAARQFAAEAPAALVRQIESLTARVLKRVRANPDRDTLDEALRVDWMMHDLIIDHMGNRTLADVHRINFDKIRLARLHRRFTPERVSPALEEHMAVIAAFRARDPDAAAAALDRHLTIAHHRAVGLAP